MKKVLKGLFPAIRPLVDLGLVVLAIAAALILWLYRRGGSGSSTKIARHALVMNAKEGGAIPWHICMKSYEQPPLEYLGTLPQNDHHDALKPARPYLEPGHRQGLSTYG